jgi:hypothetical protein
MKTPSRISFEQFCWERTAWIKENCVTDGEFQRCAKCRSHIEVVGASISLHDARFVNCAGGGKVCIVVIPFCPKCETRPDDHGCFHEQMVLITKGIWN